MSNGVLRHWASWVEPHTKAHGNDVRPRTWPLPQSVPHYWRSGELDGASVICAVVDINGDEESVRGEISKLWSPQDFRFIERKGWAREGWMPDAGRFPVKQR